MPLEIPINGSLMVGLSKVNYNVICVLREEFRRLIDARAPILSKEYCSFIYHFDSFTCH